MSVFLIVQDWSTSLVVCRNSLHSIPAMCRWTWRSPSQWSIKRVCLHWCLIQMGIMNIMLRSFFKHNLWVFAEHTFVLLLFLHLFEVCNPVFDLWLYALQIFGQLFVFAVLLAFRFAVSVVKSSGCGASPSCLHRFVIDLCPVVVVVVAVSLMVSLRVIVDLLMQVLPMADVAVIVTRWDVPVCGCREVLATWGAVV